MKSLLVVKGEEIYEDNKGELEKEHLGKVVAIEVESRTIAGIGENLDEAYEAAIKKHPGKRFYFRKIGPCPAPTYLF